MTGHSSWGTDTGVATREVGYFATAMIDSKANEAHNLVTDTGCCNRVIEERSQEKWGSH